MLTILALAMIVLFIVFLSKKKLSVFAALTLIPLVFGIIAVVVTNSSIMDLFEWIKQGIFFKSNAETGKVSLGTISPAITILFSILYFDVMLNVGLFDPVAEFFIRKAKGDPLKVLLSTVMVASIVSLNGDTTTTIIICLAAFLNLYKQLKLKLSYLAIVIAAPIGIWNQLPWGGPTIAAATAINVEISQLFRALLPGLLVAQVAVIGVAAYLGKKERRRLDFNAGSTQEVSQEHINQMLAAIRDNEPELKRPKLYWFNLLLTLGSLVLLIKGDIHGSVIFMLALAVALVVNYKTVEACTERLEALSGDALPTAVIDPWRRCILRSFIRKRHGNSPCKHHCGKHPHNPGCPIWRLFTPLSRLPRFAFSPRMLSISALHLLSAASWPSLASVPWKRAVALYGRTVLPPDQSGNSCTLYAVRRNPPELRGLSEGISFKYFWIIIVVYLVVYGITGVLPY